MVAKAHVLLIDGNRISQRSLSNTLSSIFNLTVIDDINMASINIKRSHFDVILINFDSFKEDTYQMSMLLRTERPLEPYCSMVLLSSYMCDEFIYRSIQHGINVCLPRALNGSQLCAFLLAQIKSPSTQLSFRNICTCNCLTWNYGNIHYQYSPDLQETVVAGSAEEASKIMQLMLEAERDTLARAQFGQAQVSIVKHRIDIKGASMTEVVHKDAT